MLSNGQSRSNLRQELRQELRQLRRGMDARARALASATLSARLRQLPLLQSALHIATYLPVDGEVDPSEGIAWLRDQGKNIYLPVIQQDKQLAFALWDQDQPLVSNRYGIGEPGPDAPGREADSLDAILLPLVGWDRSGQRLGMGGGFYDRTLAQAKTVTKIGLAYALQELDRVPVEEWDVRLDFVLTESGLFVANEDHATR